MSSQSFTRIVLVIVEVCGKSKKGTIPMMTNLLDQSVMLHRKMIAQANLEQSSLSRMMKTR